MSWRDPDAFETRVLADVREDYPEVIPLAQCLVLAPRIEPLLLRNVRRRFVPQAQAEIESLLWFSPLVAARSTGEIVLHLGIAKALAEEWLQHHRKAGIDAADAYAPLWQVTCELTRHWSAEDRLERDLRYYALLDDQHRLREGLRDILRAIRSEDQEGRIRLSRLAKRTLPTVFPVGVERSPAPEEAELLAQYASLALGDTGTWAGIGQPQPLPTWLGDRLPPSIGAAALGIEFRYDEAYGQVLHLVEPDEAEVQIPFPSSLPAAVHVARDPAEAGAWHAVAAGSRIRIAPPSAYVYLTTRDGRRWQIHTDQDLTAGLAPLTQPLRLCYLEADARQAQAIAGWLTRHDIPVELVPDSGAAASAVEPMLESRVVRLWTRAAQAFWAGRPESDAAMGTGLLLRTEPVDVPGGGRTPAQVIEWEDWASLESSPSAPTLLDKLRRWQAGGEVEPAPEPAREPPSPEPKPAVYSDEIAKLLAEIDNPETPPPRRLEIGDRLDELGDPRPGVGVIEIDVPVDEETPVSRVEPVEERRSQPISSLPMEALLAAIADLATEPPRRLEIGNELERRGDPRRGVGVNRHGLPDIAWMEIPGGPFTYQAGEKRELPTYWIAKYPITNEQFQPFVAAGAYRDYPRVFKMARKVLNKLSGKDESWWRDLQKPKPESPSWPQGNRPRTNVSWYEAVAYTRWLTDQLGFADGTIRLATEDEWEKAARGPDGLVYPWGNEYRSGFANVDEMEPTDGPWYLKQTTAVGLYPQGRSPYGIEDLSGNVWEWCLNKYAEQDVITVDRGGEPRVLRGGSWQVKPVNARAGSRNRDHPDERYNAYGFRVVSYVPMPLG